MPTACVIGLPLEIRSRLIARAREADVHVDIVNAKQQRDGGYRIVPSADHAGAILRNYYNAADDYGPLHVVELPYARVPDEVVAEVEEIKALRSEAGHQPWPTVAWPHQLEFKRHADFLDTLFWTLEKLLFPSELDAVAIINRIAASTDRLIIPRGALEACARVPSHRHVFIESAMCALRDYALLDGEVGTLDEFFKGRGLKYAKSGGDLECEYVVRVGGKCCHRSTTEDHLKDGDGTTAAAAVRIYFQFFVMDGKTFAAVLYAGDHPPKRNKTDKKKRWSDF